MVPAITNEEIFANELSLKPFLSFPISNNSSDGRSMLKEYKERTFEKEGLIVNERMFPYYDTVQLFTLLNR